MADFPDASGYVRTATGLIRVRSPLLTESRLISFPLATEMFQFARFASACPMYSDTDTARAVGFPIRTSSDQRLLPSPRGFSQGATSFVAFQCQGIHQMPFLYLRVHVQK